MGKLLLTGALGCWIGLVTASELYWLHGSEVILNNRDVFSCAVTQVPSDAASTMRPKAEKTLSETESLAFAEQATVRSVQAFCAEIARSADERRRLRVKGASPYQFRQSCSQQTAVPEPTGCVLLALGLAVLSVRRRRMG